MKHFLFKVFKKPFKFFSGYGLTKFYPMSVIWPKVYRKIVANMHPNLVDVQGHKMFLDSYDSLGLSMNDVYEPIETSIVNQYVKKGDVVLDIGANIGYYTLLFARLVGDEGKVYAFEPEPDNFELLKKNIEINKYENVVLIPKAVSDKVGKIRLYLSGNNKGDNRIFDSQDNRLYIDVEMTTLNDYFRDYKGKVDFVKMDIQGAEGRAVRGMTNLLSNNRQAKIISEFWPGGLDRAGTKPEEYLKTLESFGFKLNIIDEEQLKITPIEADELINIHKRHEEWNLFCVRNSA
ncbi:MAG: FkbM family methyltransferase [Planctomycetota bacterium]